MNEAYQSLERMYLTRKIFPQFCDPKNFENGELIKIADTGYLKLLKNRSPEGQKIVLQQIRTFDTAKYPEVDAVKCTVLSILIALLEEETQIAGIVFVIDLADVTKKHLLSLSTSLAMIKLLRYSKNFRLSAIYFLNLPSFANLIIDTVINFASENIKKRTFVLKEADELKNFIVPDILPEEYGGHCNIDDCFEDMATLYEKRKEILQKIFDVKVDWSKVPQSDLHEHDESENIGSFRKLEID